MKSFIKPAILTAAVVALTILSASDVHAQTAVRRNLPAVRATSPVVGNPRWNAATTYSSYYNPYNYVNPIAIQRANFNNVNPYLYQSYNPYLYPSYNPYVYPSYNPYAFPSFNPYGYYGFGY